MGLHGGGGRGSSELGQWSGAATAPHRRDGPARALLYVALSLAAAPKTAAAGACCHRSCGRDGDCLLQQCRDDIADRPPNREIGPWTREAASTMLFGAV